MKKAYLYMIRFNHFFKIGITNDVSRVHHLTKVYALYEPNLKESYLLEADKKETVRAWERFLHTEFEAYQYDFQGKQYEGYTECFDIACFHQVISFVTTLVTHRNETSSSAIQMKKGIRFDGIIQQKYRAKTKKKTIVHTQTNRESQGNMNPESKKILFTHMEQYKAYLKEAVVDSKEKTINLMFILPEAMDSDTLMKTFPLVTYESEDGRMSFSNLRFSYETNELTYQSTLYQDAASYAGIQHYFIELFDLLGVQTDALTDLFETETTQKSYPLTS